MTGSSVVPSGTDLSRHARDLARVHDAVLGGTRPPMAPRPLVSRSWSRVMRSGHDPHGRARPALAAAELERRRRESPLAAVVDELRAVLGPVADASRFVVVIADADGVVLWREGAAGVRLRADDLGFTEGALWTEEQVGTNAIGTALAEAAPVQLFSAEHYEQAQHPWYCCAAPVHDPRTGEVLGVVDVSGPALSLHPAIGALVDTAVRLAESQLWRHHRTRLDELRRAAGPLLAAVRGPLLLVDDLGWVAHADGVGAAERVAAPRAGRALVVPGLGLCVPEQVGGGWLVRPREAARSITATLVLGDRPVLEVRTDGEPWRAPLTRRHAQLLVLLHRAGPGGLSAAQLSAAVYGDADHVVTVRAEVSRLRRAVGALVDTSPYRLSDQLSLSVPA